MSGTIPENTSVHELDKTSSRSPLIEKDSARAPIQSPATSTPTFNVDHGLNEAVVPQAPHRHSQLASVKTGLLPHAEHAVDLILVQGAFKGEKFLRAFTDIIDARIKAISAGVIPSVNEKFDGMPAIVIGFSADNKPFVATKGGIFRKTSQRLISSELDIRKAFPKDSPLRPVFKEILHELRPLLRAQGFKDMQNVVFQGDLLFTKGDQKRFPTETGIAVKANLIQYDIPESSPLYSAVKNASIGFVLHTVGERVVNTETGRIELRPLNNPELIKRASEALSTEKVLALHPWRENVELPVSDFNFQVESDFRNRLRLISSRTCVLSEEFRESWAKQNLAEFRIYFNSHLKGSYDGGFYKAATTGEDFDWDKLKESYRKWAGRRDEATLKAFDEVCERHPLEIRSLTNAYFEAIALQHSLQKYLAPAMCSKLGGGPVEGLILETSDIIVKWVDRLDFTRGNNQLWNRGDGQRFSQMEVLPAPFDTWQPDAHFVLCKLQPPHAGHIKMFEEACALAGDNPVYVIASDKEPNLEATHWKELGAATTKSALKDQEYRHVFSTELRQEILAAGLDSKVEVVFISPSVIWDYLRRAKDNGSEGSIKLVVGSKEIAEQRYSEQLDVYRNQMQALAIPLQAGGVSATQIREALKSLALEGNKAARLQIEMALEFIKDPKERARIIRRMIAEWKALDKHAQKLLKSIIR